MLSFLQTLFLTLVLLVLTHEADAFISDWFEETTGTEMRVAAVAKAMQDENAQEQAKAVNVMPVHTKKTRSVRNRIRIGNAYNTVVNFGGGSARTASILPDISPARL